MKFRKEDEEEVCKKVIPGTDVDPKYRDYGGIACLRVKGHAPPCIAMMRDAAMADGVCAWCRSPIQGPHRSDCDRLKK